jgi:hypothetical protein
MDTCAHHVGPREYGPFPAIEHQQLFTQPPKSTILRRSWVLLLAIIHPSAWKECSANFACRGFSEVGFGQLEVFVLGAHAILERTHSSRSRRR